MSNGDSFQTWKEHQFKKWLAAYHSKLDLPDPQLDYFMELFDKVFLSDKSISRANIEWLNETRNGLVHFNADSYSIDRDSIIECCQEALTAIKMTPSLAKGIYFYNEEQSEKYYLSCKKAGELLDAINRNT